MQLKVDHLLGTMFDKELLKCLKESLNGLGDILDLYHSKNILYSSTLYDSCAYLSLLLKENYTKDLNQLPSILIIDSYKVQLEFI